MLIVSIIIAVEFVLILVLIVGLIVRTVKGQYMDQRRLWGTPIILAATGVIYIPFTVHALVAADVLLVIIELIVSVLVGWGLGALTTTQIAAVPDRRGRYLQIRSGWKGGALWTLFIAIRLGMQPVASVMHAQLITSPGVVLILVATARAVMAMVVSPCVARASEGIRGAQAAISRNT